MTEMREFTFFNLISEIFKKLRAIYTQRWLGCHHAFSFRCHLAGRKKWGDSERHVWLTAFRQGEESLRAEVTLINGPHPWLWTLLQATGRNWRIFSAEPTEKFQNLQPLKKGCEGGHLSVRAGYRNVLAIKNIKHVKIPNTPLYCPLSEGSLYKDLSQTHQT